MLQNLHYDTFFFSLSFLLKFLDSFLFRNQLYQIFRIRYVKLEDVTL